MRDVDVSLEEKNGRIIKLFQEKFYNFKEKRGIK